MNTALKNLNTVLTTLALLLFFCRALLIPTKLTLEEAQNITLAHNLYRRFTNPPASNMRRLVWNDVIASLAQVKAETCQYSHGRPEFHENFGKLGENIYIIEGKFPNEKFGVDRPVMMWNDEQKFFNYSANYCDYRQHCGHYTQLVWADTHLLGCGTSYCTGRVEIPESSGKVVKGATIIFCMYASAGNVQEGFLFKKKTALPYSRGQHCSKCPKTFPVCLQNLCSPNSSSVKSPQPPSQSEDDSQDIKGPTQAQQSNMEEESEEKRKTTQTLSDSFTSFEWKSSLSLFTANVTVFPVTTAKQYDITFFLCYFQPAKYNNTGIWKLTSCNIFEDVSKDRRCMVKYKTGSNDCAKKEDCESSKKRYELYRSLSCCSEDLCYKLGAKESTFLNEVTHETPISSNGILAENFTPDGAAKAEFIFHSPIFLNVLLVAYRNLI